jgi:hypothetical protein
MWDRRVTVCGEPKITLSRLAVKHPITSSSPCPLRNPESIGVDYALAEQVRRLTANAPTRILAHADAL